MIHPTQDIYTDEHGTQRFRENAIVRMLLDAGPFDLNRLATMEFNADDRMQFAQLIGYSLGGFGELSYVSTDAYNIAATMADNPTLTEQQARIQYLEEMLETVRGSLRALVPELFNVHPADLT